MLHLHKDLLASLDHKLRVRMAKFTGDSAEQLLTGPLWKLLDQRDQTRCYRIERHESDLVP